jgi:hypothetical protein
MLLQRRILAILMVFYGLIMISPVFSHIGVRGTFITIALFAALFVIFGGVEVRLQRWFVFSSMTVLLLACVPTLFWMDQRYALASIFLIFSLFLLQLSDADVIDSFLTLATALMLVLLAGAIIGFILALNGAEPLFDVTNTDGRPNHFFYSTFSVMRWGNVIRPSGIYDEPGAFSFMICAVAALRHLRGRDARVTWLMLAMGFVTLSLAHLVYVLLHAMAERLHFRNVMGIVAALLPLMLVAGYLGGFEIIEKRLFSRATITASGEVVGDNRSGKMANAAAHLGSHSGSILFGADPSCRFDKKICNEKFPFMGENPLSPLVIHGLFISWPYYLVLGLLIIAPVFGRKYMVSFAYGALLLQRPYMIGVGYSFIGLLVLATTIGSIIRDRYGEPNLTTKEYIPCVS